METRGIRCTQSAQQITVLLRADQVQALEAFAHADRRSRSSAAALAIETFLAHMAATPVAANAVQSLGARGGTATAARSGGLAEVATSRRKSK